MNDVAAGARAAGAGTSNRWLAALVALAFVAGLTLTGYAARRWGWFQRARPAAVVVAPQSAAQPAVVPQSTAASAPAALPAPAPADAVTLATREATLAGQVAALEARAAQLATDSAAAGEQAGRAEAMLVTTAARRQVDAGQPLGYLEDQLRARFGQSQPKSVAVLVAAARVPVTLGGLAAELDALQPRLAMAPQDDFLDALRRELATLVVLRRTGTASPLATDRLADAQAELGRGRVEAARATVAALPGAPAAAGWLGAARRWVLAHQALDALDAAALTIAPAPAVTLAAPTTTVMR